MELGIIQSFARVAANSKVTSFRMSRRAMTSLQFCRPYGRRISFPLTGVAPSDLTHSDNQHDCAVEHPMLIALHEAATKRAPSKIQPLQNPDPSHQNHQDTDEAADHSHHRVECTTHRAPRDKKVCVHLLREHIRKALNSGLLSMLMRLGYISVGL